MLEAKRYKVGVVGCGWVAGLQMDGGFRHLEDCYEVVACCDTALEQRDRFADHYGIERRVSQLQELLEMPDIDIVVLSTPPVTHFPMMEMVLRSGKHVICEKPLVESLARVDAIIELERQSRGRIMPIFQYRFGDGIAKIRHVIKSGIAGKAYLSTVETFKRREAQYYSAPWRGKFASELGGVLLTQAIHNHDLLLWLMGPVSSVSAVKTTRVNPIEVEDCAAACVTLADGSIASLAATLGSMRELVRFRLCFEHATFERQAYDTESSQPGVGEWTVVARNETIERAIAAKMAEVPAAPSGFAGQFQRFHMALETGGELPVTLEDARRSLELVTALFASAETGTAVQMPITHAHPKYMGWAPSSLTGRGARREPTTISQGS